MLAVALLATGLVPAAPEAPPAPGPTPPFELPATTVFTLPNGLKVTLVPYGAVPKTHVSLVVRLGNVDEPAKQTGLADLTGQAPAPGHREEERGAGGRGRERGSAARSW